MTKLVDMKIKDFLDETASKAPTPGGGSVAALAGALAAALSSMVCNLTKGKERYSNVWDKMEEMLYRSEKIRRKLEILIDKDTESFNKVMEAFNLPKESEEEKEIRKRKIQEALKGAAIVPLKTARECNEIAEVAKIIAEKGNQNSITDAVASAIMAEAGLRIAILNVKINISSIKDSRFVENIGYEIDILEKNIKEKTKEILDRTENLL